MITKSNIATTIALAHGLSQAKAEGIITDVFEAIADAVKSTEVRLHGFGTFSVTEREATTGRNPRTGAPIEIAAKRVVKFRANKAMSGAVNG